MAQPEQAGAVERPVRAAAAGYELALVPTADMDGLAPGLGPELLRLHEVQLCLDQEQLLLEDRQLQLQLWQEQGWLQQLRQEEQAWLQLWQEEQAWLRQLRQDQAWVRVEGLELALALEQLRSQGLEGLNPDGQVRLCGWGRGGGRGGLRGCLSGAQ